MLARHIYRTTNLLLFKIYKVNMTATSEDEDIRNAEKNAKDAEDHAAEATASWKKFLEEYNETILKFSKVNVRPDELRNKLTLLAHADIERVLARTKLELARTELELARSQQKGVPQSHNAEEEAGAVASSAVKDTVGAADGTDGAETTTEAEAETTTETEAETMTEAEAEAETMTEAEAEAETMTEVEAETTTEKETEVETTETEAEADKDADGADEEEKEADGAGK